MDSPTRQTTNDSLIVPFPRRKAPTAESHEFQSSHLPHVERNEEKKDALGDFSQLSTQNTSSDTNKDSKGSEGDQNNPVKNTLPKEINALLNYDTYTDLDPTLSPHLLLVVHGIGAKPEVLHANLLKIRLAINSVRKAKGDQLRAPIIIKMIDWKSALAIHAKEKIEKITLKTNKKQRMMLNEVPTDIFFYLAEDHAGNIINEVASQANYYYDKLSSKFPGLKVSFLGHSLGTVILYDLITQNKKTQYPNLQTLDFALEDVFFTGCPLGVFISLTPVDIVLLDKAGFSKGFYNIFHPNDLIAYRIEPLIPGYPDLNPMEVPYLKNDGLKNHIKKKVDQKIKDLQSLAHLDESAIIASLTRYDYVLQEGLLENMFETIGMISGHWGYWESQDLFYFIMKKLHSKTKNNRTDISANL